MKLTAALKKFLVDQCGVKADATDDEFRKAAGLALAEGKLSGEKYVELTTDQKASGEAMALSDKLDAVIGGIGALTKAIAAGQKPVEDVKAEDTATKTAEKDPPISKEKKVEPTGKKAEWFEKMTQRMSASDSGDGDDVIHVKGAWENYRTDNKSVVMYPERTKSGKPHLLAGRPVMDFGEHGRPIQSATDLDKAVAGAYAKFMIATATRGNSKTFGFQSLNQHDKELMYYAMEHMEWGGCGIDNMDKNYADINGRKLTMREQKALIDDSASGGLEAAPIVFDDMVIQAPLLNGELYPLVNVIPLDRGRRVEGVSTGTVTGGWGGIDDTAIALFTTTSYVSAFDTTVFRWEGAIRIGLDFLSDTPIDFGAHVTAQYGERLLEDLDDVIATGDGTTQPEGIMNKTGATSVSWGATTSIGNYESTRFGVTKQEHKANLAATAVWCGTETSYARARAIPVGTNDARRLGGMDYSSYTWMERPYKLNASLTNAQIFYAILGRYRMYRRRGLTIRTSTEGDTLIRANELLIAVTARYGGQQERGATIARTTTAPARLAHPSL